MVDWDAGSYETTSGPELEPVSEVVVDAAGIAAGEDVLDLAAGTGNAALAAAGRGARVVAIDGAPRLLGVAGKRAQAQGIELETREGDLLALPAADACADVAVSVFGIIFAPDPERALRELARVLRPGGRAALSAWVPSGPVAAMVGEAGRVMARITGQAPPERFAWHDPAVLEPAAAHAGLRLTATTAHRLPIRDRSPEDYLERNRSQPMAVGAQALLAGAGAENELREAQLSILRPANQDPSGFLVHSPYVVHELRAAGG